MQGQNKFETLEGQGEKDAELVDGGKSNKGEKNGKLVTKQWIEDKFTDLQKQ